MYNNDAIFVSSYPDQNHVPSVEHCLQMPIKQQPHQMVNNDAQLFLL